MLAGKRDRVVEALALALALSCVGACGSGGPVDYFAPSGMQDSTGLGGGNAGDSAGNRSAGGGSSAGSGASVNGGGAASAGSAGSGGSSGTAGSSVTGGSPASGGFANGGSAGEAGSAGNREAAAGDRGLLSKPDDPPCSPVMEGGKGASGPFGTLDASCWRVSTDITGWGCNSMQGRTVKVNGTQVTCGQMPLPEKLLGAYYFEFSAGAHDYADFYWF